MPVPGRSGHRLRSHIPEMRNGPYCSGRNLISHSPPSCLDVNLQWTCISKDSSGTVNERAKDKIRFANVNSGNLRAPSCSKPFLQFIPAVPVRVIFECAVYRIAEFPEEVHIPVTGIGQNSTGAVFLRFPPYIRKDTGTHALIAVWFVHPQHFHKSDVPEIHTRKACSCRFTVSALNLSPNPFKAIMHSRHL